MDLLLAGPILRRVEPNLVSVWIALQESATVKLSLWEGSQVKPGDRDPLITGPDPAVSTIRVGDKLHVVTVSLKLPSGKALTAGRSYSYDLTIQSASGTNTLKTLGLLQDNPSADIDHNPNIKNLALGYEPNVLPGFAWCPPELTDLRIVHGSCRRLGFNTQDGQAWVDDLISKDKAYTDPLKRLHQMFLTGDQIYADDVPRPLLQALIEAGLTLIGKRDKNGKPIQIEQFKIGGQVQDADGDSFFPGKRDDLIEVEARMTSKDGVSHLISFAEFCAMYLFSWSPAVWPDKLPEVEVFLTDEEKNDPAILEQKRKEYLSELEPVIECRRTMPKVRRSLANVPTYMIFDDHEVSDDWYLNPTWRDRVLTSPLGRTIIRNALVSYALFQGWGNDPAKFESAEPKQLLTLATQLFPAGATTGPNETAANQIDTLLGLDQNTELEGANPPIKWNYTVTGEKHQVIVLDNRTRRSYVSRLGPPGNVSVTAQQDQIPQAPTDPAKKKDVVFVISSLVVLGPPIFDELLAPTIYRTFDVIGFNKLQERERADGTKVALGSKGLVGTNPDAIEAWAFDPKTLEALLRRLEPYRKVILLSGDVHYSASNALSYWKKTDTEPARFAQFISSGIRNIMPSYIQFADRSLAFAQKLIRAKLGSKLLGWDSKTPDPLILPVGANVVPSLRSKLKSSPVLIPTDGWPAGTKLNPVHMPDWSWSLDWVTDGRKDSERPKAAQPIPLDPANPTADVGENVDIAAYRTIANRHARQIQRLSNSRQLLFASSIGLVRFEKQGDIPIAIHELYTTFPDPDDPLNERPKPLAYTQHKVPLRTPNEKRPEEDFK